MQHATMDRHDERRKAEFAKRFAMHRVTLLLILLLSVCWAGSAHAVFTSTLAGSTATMTGATNDDTIIFDQSGGLLRHNRFTAGDPGFNSDFDFDSTVAGDQTLAVNAASAVIVNTNNHNVTQRVGNATTAASALLAHFTFNSSTSDGDSLTVDDSASATANTISYDALTVGGDWNQCDKQCV